MKFSTKPLLTFLCIAFLFVSSYSQSFIKGSSQLTLCKNAGATSIDSLLGVQGLSVLNSYSLFVSTAPSHGTLSGFSSFDYTTQFASGLYTPNTGFSGTDIFILWLYEDDGGGGAFVSSTTINVTVNAPNASPIITVNPNNSSICTGNNTNFSITATGSSLNYSWNVSTDGGNTYNSLSNGGVYSGVTTNTLSLTNATASLNNYKYRCVVNDVCSPSSTSTAAILNLNTGTWNGSVSNDFTVAGNWTTACSLNANFNAIIANVSPSPQLSTTTSVNNLTVNSGASLTVTGTLQVAGSITYNGTPISGSGSITMNGTSAQSINGNLSLANLTINNTSGGVTLNGPVAVTGVLSPTAGTLNTNGNLTLKSTSITNTAMVGPVGGTINGNVTVERYIPAGQRGYRFLSSGVTTSTNIHANWQEGATSSTNNPNPGYGTHITGSTVDQTNGFDRTSTGNPSMFTFDNTSKAWSAISNTNSNTLQALVPYRILIRGDRTTNLSTNTPSVTATTLRATGTLVTGSVTYSDVFGGLPLSLGYNFITNPYWAPVDWSALYKAHVADTYWLWDPTRAGSNNRGAYVSYTSGSGASGGGTINQFIQPGQAFFILGQADYMEFEFTENKKAVNSANLTSTFGAEATKPRLNIELYLANNTNSADATALVFDNNFSNGIGNEDANKFTNPDENIAINNNNVLLGLDGRPLPTTNDTIPLSTTNLFSKAYTLKLNTNNFSSYNNDISLIDKYTNQTYPIDKTGATTIVPYNISTDTASSAANRFAIVFSAKKITTTPIDPTDKFTVSIAGNPTSDNVTVNYAAPKAGNTSIRLINVNGKSVSTMNLGMQRQGQAIIPVKQFANGIYLIEVQIGGDTVIKKIMKN